MISFYCGLGPDQTGWVWYHWGGSSAQIWGRRVLANQRPVLGSCDHSGPMRGRDMRAESLLKRIDPWGRIVYPEYPESQYRSPWLICQEQKIIGSFDTTFIHKHQTFSLSGAAYLDLTSWSDTTSREYTKERVRQTKFKPLKKLI